GQNGSC
ncbi:hypothetical protein D030_3452B, partial [Vibrio parahaemolyticus AQ3810]